MVDLIPYTSCPPLSLKEVVAIKNAIDDPPKSWEPQVGDVVFMLLPVKVFRDLGSGKMDVCDDNGNCIQVSKKALSKHFNTEFNMKAMKDAILKIAKNLLKANNQVTTLEIKTELRRDYPYFHSPQSDVSTYMDQLAGDGHFTYTDNGTFRIYSLATPAQVAAQTGPVTASLTIASGRKRGRPRKALASVGNFMTRSAAQGVVFGGNFDSISVDGTLVTRADIKAQKKSPKGYLTTNKLNKLDGITVNGKAYKVS